MSVSITSYGIRNKKFGIDETGTADVSIRNWDIDTLVKDVPFKKGDSDVWIVSKAIVLSEVNWKWPWWRFSARRKLAYLRKNGVGK